MMETKMAEDTNRYADLMKQGFMKGAAVKPVKRVSDEQFRENIRQDVLRRNRIMFGEEAA